MLNTNETKKLEIGQKVNVDGFGLCTVKRVAWNGIITIHYFAVTKFGDSIRICWNSLLNCWIKYEQH